MASAELRSPVVVFLGIDGAGKTTQALLLAAWLRTFGSDVVEFVGPRPSFVQQVLDPIARDVGEPDCWSLVGPDAVRLAGSLATLRDLTREVLPLLAGPDRMLVADRYAHCQYAVGRVFEAGNEWLIRRICAPLPRPTLTFYLDVDVSSARRRLALRGEGEETATYLRRLDDAYRDLPEAADYIHLDAEQPIQAVHAAACAHCVERLPGLFLPPE
jgi:dTMP kinase